VSVPECPKPAGKSKRRPLYGPIPWCWLVPAVCWLSAGWGRSAEFELASDGWAEFGLSRFSASRGLGELERAGLVSVVRLPGRTSGVTIQEVGRGW
jgi:hypothetical protein